MQFRQRDDENTITWLFEACSWIRWGFIFKSIIFLSTLSFRPSELVTDIRTGETWRFCLFSPAVAFCGRFCPLLVSPGYIGCGAGSSGWGWSPGNYEQPEKSNFKGIRHKRKKIVGVLYRKQWQTSIFCLDRRYLPCVLLPPTWTVISQCKQRELPSVSQ